MVLFFRYYVALEQTARTLYLSALGVLYCKVSSFIIIFSDLMRNNRDILKFTHATRIFRTFTECPYVKRPPRAGSRQERRGGRSCRLPGVPGKFDKGRLHP